MLRPLQTGSLLAPGSVLGGDFVIVRLLGSGGMGSVYVAEQKSTGKLRALKVMHRDIAPNTTLQRRFEQEARVGAQIKSGHIVEVVAAGIDGETELPFIIMELLEGVDLRTHIATAGALPVPEVRRLFEQLCHGMAAAHAGGIVHRDLKPENIFLARPNQAGAVESVVKVLDFGIAKLASEATTQATAAIGSPLWMAPEQTAPGPVTPAADVWALGLIAYELLTGQHFWRAAILPTATPMHLLREIVLEPIQPASERAAERGHTTLPAGFDAWFARCVDRDPKARFADAGEAWQAMQRFMTNGTGNTGFSVRPPSSGPEALAATLAADHPSMAPPPSRSRLAETPLAISGASVPPAASASVAQVVHAAQAAAPSTGTRASIASWLALALGAGGLVGGVAIARRAPAPRVNDTAAALSMGAPAASAAIGSTSSPPVPAAASSAPPPALTLPVAPPPRPPSVGLPPVVPVPVAPEPPPKAPRQTVAARSDGFSDPADGSRRGAGNATPFVATIQGHRVRLLTRLVSNNGNVADDVVRGAVDWSSWEYQRCYEGAFGSAKTFPDGTVTVAFDILDQLPRHAALQASTFDSPVVGDCVTRTLGAQTMNAARSQGMGHVVYAFKFVAD
jgi:serine/threonine protein kinase